MGGGPHLCGKELTCKAADIVDDVVMQRRQNALCVIIHTYNVALHTR